MFQLGFTYVDRVTGHTGMAIGHVRYITGCNQVLIQPRTGEDGKRRDSEWFDEQRLERAASDEPQLILDNSKTPGFDREAPKR